MFSGRIARTETAKLTRTRINLHDNRGGAQLIRPLRMRREIRLPSESGFYFSFAVDASFDSFYLAVFVKKINKKTLCAACVNRIGRTRKVRLYSNYRPRDISSFRPALVRFSFRNDLKIHLDIT